MFEDSIWVKAHDAMWFIAAYRYLTELFHVGRDYRGMKIIPTDNASLCSPDQVFLPLDSTQNNVFRKIPKQYRKKVDFLSSELLNAIEHEADGEDLLRLFAFKSFSISMFVTKVLIPEFNANLEEQTSADFKVLFEYLMTCGIDLDDEIKESLKDFPLLLNNDQVVTRRSVDGRELVTPKSWDKDKGWQLLFNKETDFERLAILNDYYCTMDRGRVGKYFFAITATEIPDAEELVLYAYVKTPSLDDDYIGYINDEFLTNYKIHSTQTRKKVTTWGAPSVFSTSNPLRNKPRQALVNWLNQIYSHRSGRLRYAIGDYFYYGPLSKTYDSALYRALVTMDWVKTSKGYRRPGQVFVKDETINRIFGNKIPYLEDYFTNDVIKYLGINRGATNESLINYLSDLRQDTDVQKSTVAEIYRYLSDYGDGYESQFETEPLIYVPQSGGKWLKSSEVIWDDASEIVGESFGWLSSYYPESLRNFFVEKLSVHPRLDDEAYANAWLRTQGGEGNAKKVENILTKAIPAIIRALGDVQNPWIGDFIERASVWTQDKIWETPNNVYVPDDTRLRSLFSDSLYFVWRPSNMTHARLEPFYTSLSISNLSQVSKYSVASHTIKSTASSTLFLTEYTQWLLVYALVNFDKEGTDEFLKCYQSGQLEILFSLDEIKVERLVVNVEVNDHVAEITDAASFFDIDKRHLYINSNADREDVLDDIANEVSRFLWGRRFKQYSDTVRKFIGVSSESRYKKLRDNDAWHISPEYNRLVRELIETSKALDAAKEQKNTTPAVNTPIEDTAGEGSVSSIMEDEQVENPSNPEQTSVPTPYSQREEKEPWSNNRPRATDNAEQRPFGSRQDGSTRSGGEEHSPTSSGQHPEMGAHSRPVSRSGKRSARSKGLASTINQARRNRMLSYVVSDLTEDSEIEKNSEYQSARKALGDKGELTVFNDLEVKGYEVKRMPLNNPGYDLEAVHPKTGEMLIIEVKGESFGWSEKGVGISSTQYQKAKEMGGAFYLAIVDNLRQSPSNIYYIQDPVAYISEYRFDCGWEGLATDIPAVEGSVEVKSDYEKLLEFTDSDECVNIISYCREQGYPYPEVGCELKNEVGEVVFEAVELSWDEVRFGVVLTDNEKQQAIAVDDSWTFLTCGKESDIKYHLDKIFNSDSGANIS